MLHESVKSISVQIMVTICASEKLCMPFEEK